MFLVGIVSGGADHNVCVVDIGTGTVLQTLRGHTNQIVTLAFDSERIVSASRDSTLRYWKWGEKRHAPADKYHVMDKGDTLPFVARNYDITLQDLMKWNGVKEVRDCYPGMRLIVRKANPDQLTKAELAEYDKERKRLKGQNQTNAKIKQIQMERGELFAKHSRVYKLATDIDPHSLGNRMFKKQKLDSELYPEKDDFYTDHQSLASRIKSNTGNKREFHTMGARYFPTKANMDEWGDISDSLGEAMLETFIEFIAYEMVTEEKRKIRDHLSVLGRMQMAPALKAENTRLLLTKKSSSTVKDEMIRALPPIEWKLSFGPVIEEDSRKIMVASEGDAQAERDAEGEDAGLFDKDDDDNNGGDHTELDREIPRDTEEKAHRGGVEEGAEDDYGLIGFGARTASADAADVLGVGSVRESANSDRKESVSSGSRLDVDEEDSDFLSLMKSSVGMGGGSNDGDY